MWVAADLATVVVRATARATAVATAMVVVAEAEVAMTTAVAAGNLSKMLNFGLTTAAVELSWEVRACSMTSTPRGAM